jgi:hypothetical protein
MNGFERLQEQIKDQEDLALRQVVEHLLTMKHMEQNYLKDEKNLADMCKFIKKMAQKHAKNGWNFVTNEIVYAWATMYFSLPNKYLKIEDEPKGKKPKTNKENNALQPKNNVVSMEKAKKELEEKKKTEQLSLFGGVA